MALRRGGGLPRRKQRVVRKELSAHSLSLLPSQQLVKNVLEESREKHKSAVQERIDSVGELNDVVSLTKAMFALSKVRLLLLFFLIFLCRCICVSMYLGDGRWT